MPTAKGHQIVIVFLQFKTDKQYSEMILDTFSTDKKADEFMDAYGAENPGAGLSKGYSIVK